MKKIILLTSLAFSINAFSQVPNYVPTSGLQGWWPFTGNANDSSINGNNGTVYGATLTNDRFGNTNSSYSFNGFDNYINIGSNILFTNEYTYSAWVYLDSAILQPRAVIISKLQSTGIYQYKGSELNINNQQHFLTIQGNDTLYIYFEDTTNIVPLNQWTHIVATYDGQYIKHYVNGNFIDSTTAYYLADSLGSPIFFGARPWDTSGPYWFMNGIIDDIGIWNRALTQIEITTLFQSITTGVNEIDNKNYLVVYPNPASDIITIKANSHLLGSTYTITDQLGRSVLSGKLTSESSAINIHELPVGIYVFKAGEQNQQSFKVMKK